MKAAQRYALVMVTAPDLKSARKLVRSALEKRLAACGNLIPKLESHYWWQGKIQKSFEVLILFKTTATLMEGLEEMILAEHPYDTPEVIAIPLSQGTARYLNWIDDSVGSAPSGISD